MNADQLRRANVTDRARFRTEVLRALSQCGARADFIDSADENAGSLVLRIQPLTPERELRLHGLLARIQGIVGQPVAHNDGLLVLRFQSQNGATP
jgi:hypothetical protein